MKSDLTQINVNNLYINTKNNQSINSLLIVLKDRHLRWYYFYGNIWNWQSNLSFLVNFKLFTKYKSDKLIGKVVNFSKEATYKVSNCIYVQ